MPNISTNEINKDKEKADLFNGTHTVSYTSLVHQYWRQLCNNIDNNGKISKLQLNMPLAPVVNFIVHLQCIHCLEGQILGEFAIYLDHTGS